MACKALELDAAIRGAVRRFSSGAASASWSIGGLVGQLRGKASYNAGISKP